MSPKQKFAEGEKVLCFHGPLIYEAKALKSTITKDKQVKYYIHYAGWNKNWDEWVPENRVLKYNEANVQRQKEVFRIHNVNNAGKNKKGLEMVSSSKGRKSDVGSSSVTTTKESGASSGGSESRASTPSKDAANISNSNTRSNRSKLAEPASKKEDKDNDISKDIERDEPTTKKKRGTSNNVTTANNSEKSERTSATNTTATTLTSTTTVSTVATTGSSSSASSTSSTSSSVNNVNTRAGSIEGDNFITKSEIKIKIPDELKQYLVDDWDAVTRQHKLLDIPAKCTVQDIADEYILSKKTLKTYSMSKESALSDMVNGVVEYFNVMLGSQLLYKFERPQYAEILQRYPDTPLSKLYGGFHLLRLFVKLGTKLGYTTLDDKGMQTLLNHLHDFLRFLVKNTSSYFNMSNFINVSPEYHRHTQ